MRVHAGMSGLLTRMSLCRAWIPICFAHAYVRYTRKDVWYMVGSQEVFTDWTNNRMNEEDREYQKKCSEFLEKTCLAPFENGVAVRHMGLERPAYTGGGTDE